MSKLQFQFSDKFKAELKSALKEKVQKMQDKANLQCAMSTVTIFKPSEFYRNGKEYFPKFFANQYVQAIHLEDLKSHINISDYTLSPADSNIMDQHMREVIFAIVQLSVKYLSEFKSVYDICAASLADRENGNLVTREYLNKHGIYITVLPELNCSDILNTLASDFKSAKIPYKFDIDDCGKLNLMLDLDSDKAEDIDSEYFNTIHIYPKQDDPDCYIVNLGADIGMDDSVFASLSDSTQMQRLIKILQIADHYGNF